MRKIFSKAGLLVLLAILGISTVAFQVTDIYFLIKKNFSIFSKAYENVALEYVDEVDPEVLMRNGMEAMLETLDPYTVFYNESQNEQAEIFSRSNYAGVGIDAGFRDGEVVVVAPTEGGPADQKGVRAGDVIVAIDGVSTEGLLPEEVQNLTMGEIGSSLTLTINRFGLDQPIDFELTRASIEIKNVTHTTHLGDNSEFGYIRLAQFGMNSANEIRTAIEELSADNALNGLVLDLRDNPGGILQEAVAIVDKFVEPGITVVETRGRIQEYNAAYETREPVMFDKPVIVLMNAGSASASEVVAGALQDLDRAVILGETSFGKGLVQIVKPMPYNTSMKITISRYYTPSGRSIQSLAYTHQARNASISRQETANRVFKTRNGRDVKEGRGIEPDVQSGTSIPGLLEISLMQEGVYFDFATQFESQNSSFESEQMPDQVFEDFRVFLDESGFDYKTDSELLLEELEAKHNNDEVKASIESIREVIQKEKEQNFKDSEQEIRKALYLELISRYQGQTLQREASLRLDDQLEEAINLLTNSDQVSSILNGRG
ncbi:MAG: S41 family peptidase [Balneolaceae bacterium]|nr:S41 family peptidase [Balneolaceae bacterium]MBO6547618.1 S41 family peptidase [Balneolaceae bacterium]MBO6648129.1 S41 family peptidase [Balneolaceae bacterium]